MKPRVGEVYQERYRIIAELGTGGMGSVFHAEQIDVNRQVALKLLHEEKLEDSDTVTRFFREFKLLSQLCHPNIMTIYGMALDGDSRPFAICEFIDGVSLRKLIAQGPLPLERTIKIAVQICHAMQYAHDLGILHRDLKPDNVLIMDRPEPDFVKLVDFGLSRALESIGGTQHLTATGFIVGSPQYMSPEQIKGKAERQSDIYSLGCLLFECLSGKVLFDGELPAGVIYRQLNESPLPRLKTLRGMPPGLLQILGKMLGKTIEERYQSMADVATDLEGLENPQVNSEAQAFDHRGIMLPAAIILAALVLLTSAVIFAGFGLHHQKTKTRHQSAITEKGSPTQMQATAVGHAVSPAVLIDQAHSLRKDGNSNEAVELLKKAVRFMKDDDPYLKYDAHYELASCYALQKNYNAAIKEFQSAIDCFPLPYAAKRIGAGCALAHLYAQSGDREKADVTYQRFIAAAEQSGNANANSMMSAMDEYAIFLHEQGKTEDGYKWARRAMSYADHSVHGTSMNHAFDRATGEAVKCTWIYYNACRLVGKEAEGRREVEKTLSQLEGTSLRDDHRLRSMLYFAKGARQNGFPELARKVYETISKDSRELPDNKAMEIQAACTEGLERLK